MLTTSESDSSSSEDLEESIDKEEGPIDDSSGSEGSGSKASSPLGGESEKPLIADEQYAGSKEIDYTKTLEVIDYQKLKGGHSTRRIEEALRVCVPAGFMIDKRIVSRVDGDKVEERESNCFPKKMYKKTADAERCTKEGHFESGFFVHQIWTLKLSYVKLSQ